MASYPPSIPYIVNGTDVDAPTTNVPLQALSDRTDWLKSQVQTILAGSQVILRGVPILAGTLPGTPVYYDDITGQFKPAQAKPSATLAMGDLADATAYWQGLVQTIAGSVGDIILIGTMTQAMAYWSSVIVGNPVSPAPGNYFLDTATPGKITSVPGTLGVYIGHLTAGGEMLVTGSNMTAFLQHVHQKCTLLGKPAGTVIDPPVGGTHVVNTPDPSQQGWLPANATYFPGYVVGVQIPVGAKFGYNIANPAETTLQALFPPVPPENAQLSQGGSLITDDYVTINNYGIWWMKNTYGDAPWPVDYAVTTTATDITLWTTRMIAEADLSSIFQSELTGDIVGGEFDPYIVRKLTTTSLDTLGLTGTGNNVSGFTGLLQLDNKAVTRVSTRRGMLLSSPSSDVNGFYRNTVVDYSGTVPVEFQDSSTTPVRSLFTTNGVSSGVVMGLMAYAMGPLGTDYLTFSTTLGPEYAAAQLFQVGFRINGGVDVPSAPPVSKNLDIDIYLFNPGSPASTSSLVKSTTMSLVEGTPGAVQQVQLGPFADVLAVAGTQIVLRIKNSGGGSPVTFGKGRILTIGTILQAV